MLLLNACQQPVFLDYEVWILEEGAWNDSGIWKDPSTWDDGGNVGPTAIAVADFKNGIYSIGGVSKTLADLFIEDADNWGAWDPANVQAGVGLVSSASSYPVATAALLTAILPGFTVVIEGTTAGGVSPVDDGPATGITLTDFPSYTKDVDSVVLQTAGTIKAVVRNTASGASTPATVSGAYKIAARMGSGATDAISTGGATTQAIASDNGTPNAVAISATFGIITKITFYAPQDNATLQSLSA